MRALSWALFAALLAACSSSSQPGDGSGVPAEGPKQPADTTSGGPSETTPPPPSPTGTSDPGKPPPKPTTYTRKTLSFDDLAAGTAVTDQFKTWATFSSEGDCALETSSSAGLAASKPYYLFTYYSCAKGSTAPMFIDFAKPVRAPKLKLIGVNSSAKAAKVRIVHVDGTKTEEDAIGKGNYAVPVVVDLASEKDVKRLEIVDVSDAYGLGFDDVEFDFPDE